MADMDMVDGGERWRGVSAHRAAKWYLAEYRDDPEEALIHCLQDNPIREGKGMSVNNYNRFWANVRTFIRKAR